MKKVIAILFLVVFGVNWVFARESCEYKKVSEEYERMWILRYFPDQKDFAFAVSENEEWFIVKDWIKSKKYEKVWSFNYSNVDNKMAFVGIKWEKYIVIKDWKEGKEYDGIKNSMYCWNSEDFLFIAKENWKMFIVKNWNEWKKYDDIYELVCSPNWKEYAFTAKKDWKRIVVKKLKESQKYSYVYNINYSPDWKGFAFTAERDWGRFLVKDWEESNKYYNIYYTYSPNGESLVFRARKNDDKWVVVKDWKKIWEYDKIENIRYSFYLDWKSFVFRAERDWKEFFVKDWKELQKYDNVSQFSYSSDGKSYSFIATNNWKEFIVKDGQELSKFDDIYRLEYFDKWENIIFVARDWNKLLLVKENENADYDIIYELKYYYLDKSIDVDAEDNPFSHMIMSSDPRLYIFGETSLFKAEKDRKIVIVKNSEEINRYDYADSLINSLNWKSFAFTARKDWERIIVKDWKEILKNEYDYVSDIWYTSNNEIYFQAEENWKQFIVQEICTSTTQLSETKETLTQNIKTLKTKLQNNSKYSSLVNKIDEIISSVSDEKLFIVYERIDKLNLNNPNASEYKDIFTYLKSKIWVEIYKRELDE